MGQEPCLLNESIRFNILNSNPSATEQDIWEALTLSNASEFVKALPEGIETEVGTVGSKLSGGQKQRLAITRALIRKPDAIIFDEATSALDIKSEQEVQTLIDSIHGSSLTKIIIAHRLSTIKDADKIILVKDGRVEGEGPHQELLESSVFYSQLYNIQTESEIEQEESKTLNNEPLNLKYKLERILLNIPKCLSKLMRGYLEQ